MAATTTLVSRSSTHKQHATHKREPAERPECSMPNCSDPSLRLSGGMCSACTSWVYRIHQHTPSSLKTYFYRQKRMASRVRFWSSSSDAKN